MPITSGASGIDTPRQLLPPTIQGVISDGYKFVNRYISRALYVNPTDLRGIEADTIRRMGLAIGFVQHFPPGGPWMPSTLVSRADAYAACRQLRAIGVPDGKTVWFDLENTHKSASHSLIVDCVNVWSEIIDDEGYQSGAYVGKNTYAPYACPLSPAALFHELRVTRYWASYNLNRDEYPAVRGVCMRQHPHNPGREWANVNTIHTDAIGGLPSFWEANE